MEITHIQAFALGLHVCGWLGKPLLRFRVNFLQVVQQWYVIPGLYTWVGFTREVAKVAFASPSHFIVDSACFFDAPILVKRFPPWRPLRPEVRGGRGGGSLLLLLLFLPPLVVGRDGEGVQVGSLYLPEPLRS